MASRAEYMAKRVEQARQEAIDRPILSRDKIKVNLDPDRSGKKVLEIKGLSKSFNGQELFEPFDFTILYGGRLGIVAGNGTGRTKLLKTMLEEIPDVAGTVRI